MDLTIGQAVGKIFHMCKRIEDRLDRIEKRLEETESPNTGSNPGKPTSVFDLPANRSDS